MKQSEFDRLIQAAVREELNHCPHPPLASADAWKQLLARSDETLKSKTSKTNILQKRKNVLIACLTLIILYAVWDVSQHGFAYRHVAAASQKVQDVMDQGFSLSFSGDQPESEPSQGNRVSFPLPQYMPDQFRLVNVAWQKDDEQIVFTYAKENQVVSIAGEQQQGRSKFNIEENEEALMINNQPAFIHTDGHSTTLRMEKEDWILTIQGSISQHDLVKIAQSM